MRDLDAVRTKRSTAAACALLGAILLPTLAAQQPAPKHLALLVGIDEYQQPDSGDVVFPRLRGAERDVARVRDLLQSRFGFAPADIVTLCGKQATHEAIVRAFHTHLVARADDDTRVVFWFSGHGSQVPDPSHDDTANTEDDTARDQTLLAYDSRSGDRNGSYDLTDDELHSLLAKVRARDLVVVTDCCHSGGAVRGANDGRRGLDEGARPLDRAAIEPFWPATVPFLDDDRGTVAEHVVHLAACDSTEEAGEIDTEDGWHGTLTWFLTGVLAEVPADTSWRAVLEHVRARVAGCGSRGGQMVQGDGELGRAIFGGQGRPLPAGYIVQRVTDTLLWIGAGRIHGIADGTQLRLVDADGAELALARVRRTNASDCRAEIATGQLGTAAVWAVPHGPLTGSSPLHVFCGDGIDKGLLAEDPFVKPVAAASDAEYVVTCGARGLALQLPDGTFVRTMPEDAGRARSELFREHCFRSLWEGVTQTGPACIALEVAAASADDVARYQGRFPSASVTVDAKAPRADVTAPWLGKDARGRSTGGALVRFTLRNDGKEALFLALLSLAENREVNVIYGRDGNNQLKPGASVQCLAVVGPVREWPRQRPMRDRYLAIATVRRADFRPFESEGTFVATRGGDDVPLPPFLARALGGTTRGGGDAPTWGISWLDLEVKPATATGGK